MVVMKNQLADQRKILQIKKKKKKKKPKTDYH